MATMSIGYKIQNSLEEIARTDKNSDVVMVAAFRGNVTSPPVYIYSNDKGATGETGIVDQLGLVITLGMLYIHKFTLIYI